MTPGEARQLFFQHLPLVRNSSDLLRLTLRVLPHLPEAPDRPLGAINTMAFRLQLEHSKFDDTVRVWYSSNRDVSSQLRSLEPFYPRGSSGPSFCSGLSDRMKLSNGPNVHGTGLPLGVFEQEHLAAKKGLDAATSVEQWWTLSSSRPENLANSPPRAKRVRRMRNERLRAAGTFMVTSGPGYTWPIAS